MISAESILIAGFCSIACCRIRPSIVVAALFAFFSWAYFDSRYAQLDLGLAVRGVEGTFDGIKARVFEPDRLRNEFAKANETIQKGLPLPRLTGTVDVYPWELSTVFAHRYTWSPRPVIQSYAAFTPELEALNADHLSSQNAPQHVFFAVQAIDNRLPSLEDAGSWSMLLQQYRIEGFDGNWIHFQRIGAKLDPLDHEQPIEQLVTKIGSDAKVPQGRGPIWAQIRLQETLMGKAVDRLFKLPAIAISLTLADGTTVHKRYIPVMGQRGFLISPFIPDTKSFGRFATGMLDLQNVRSMRIEASKTKFWRHRFEVTFRHFGMSPQADAKQFFVGTRSDRRAGSIHSSDRVAEKYMLDSSEQFDREVASDDEFLESSKLTATP
jgi:hypothetical protein